MKHDWVRDFDEPPVVGLHVPTRQSLRQGSVTHEWYTCSVCGKSVLSRRGFVPDDNLWETWGIRDCDEEVAKSVTVS